MRIGDKNPAPLPQQVIFVRNQKSDRSMVINRTKIFTVIASEVKQSQPSRWLHFPSLHKALPFS
ncbi:hypothetical protein NIES2100_58340 [Calothrix sp. NIES-2100]|nr:hypothetical protein NIES2100_58340 [Calothrix sp. NIES-2100]